jgi:Icc-related predicted phosphoesterase
MLTHNSPAGVHDDPDHDPHAGYQSFSRRIQNVPPKLWLHGHQHKNVTTVVNGCAVIGVFGAALIEWDGCSARVSWKVSPF